MVSGVAKTLLIFLLISLLALIFFDYNIFELGSVNLFFFFVNLIIFSWVIGIAVLGAIFRFGTRIQALAWGLIFLFQPLTASFFPAETLPSFLQKVAFALPATYIFEAARKSLVDPTTHWDLITIAFLLNVVYFAASLYFFNYMFRKSKESGQFARNEG
jgi:ABC-2 type transport system permease protein